LLDRSTRRIILGSVLEICGDPRRDMEPIRRFFAHAGGIHPERVGPVSLCEEDGRPQEDGTDA
jgi:hypothetical protein